MAPEPAPSPGDTESRPADASPKNALSCAPFSKKFPLRSTLLVPSEFRLSLQRRISCGPETIVTRLASSST